MSVKSLLRILSGPTLLCIPILFIAAVSVFVLLFGLLNAPIADDFAFYYNLQANGYLRELVHFYLNESGRITHGVVTHTGYLLFGFHADKILPFITWSGIAAGVGTLLYQLKIFNKKSQYIVAGVLVATTFLFAVPSLFDSFLWYTASYATSLIFLTLDFILLVALLHNRQMALWKKLLIWGLMFVGQMYFELTGIVVLALVGCIYLATLIQKRFELWKVFIPSLTSLTLGLIVVLASPVFRARRQAEAHLNVAEITRASFSDLGVIFDSAFGLLPVVLIFATGVFISGSLNLTVWKNESRKLRLSSSRLWLLLSAFAVVTIGFCLAVKNYAHGGEQMYRTMTVPSFGLIVALTVIATCAACRAGTIFRASQAKLLLVASLLLLLALPLVVQESYKTIIALTLRQHATHERDTSVRAQIANNSPKLILTHAPINLKANALDCFHDPRMAYKDDINWVCVTYLLSQGGNVDNTQSIEIRPSIVDYEKQYPLNTR